MMISRQLICGAALALLLAGCSQAVTRATKMNTPVVVTAFGIYSFEACTSAEPPEPTVTSQPANGQVRLSLGRSPITVKGHPCEGKMLDRAVVTYQPRAGFRGEDRFSVRFDYITGDGGGRATQSQDITVQVK